MQDEAKPETDPETTVAAKTPERRVPGFNACPKYWPANGLKGAVQMIRQLQDKKVIFFDVGYTLDAPADESARPLAQFFQ